MTTRDPSPLDETLADDLRGSPDRAVRLRAAAALGDRPRAWDRLTFGLNDRDPEVRAACAAALARQLAAAPALGTDYLTARLEDDYRAKAILAAEILVHRGIAPQEVTDAGYLFAVYVNAGPAGIRTLCRAIAADDGDGRNEIAMCLSNDRLRTQATVRELLDDPSLGASMTAAATLGRWDLPWSVEALMRAAGDAARPRKLRDEALAALARLEAPEAGEMLAATPRGAWCSFRPFTSPRSSCAIGPRSRASSPSKRWIAPSRGRCDVVALDTNVIVRVLVGDDPAQTRSTSAWRARAA